MKYIINNSEIVFFHSGRPIKVAKGSNQYLKIIRAFDLDPSQQDEAIQNILNENKNSFERDGFTITPDSISYDGEDLPPALTDKIRSIMNEGLPISLFGKFWQNLKENPSSSSVSQLYDFLAYKELPITEDGCFLAYKGVTAAYWSISGNTKTKVLKGIVDKSGRIFNGIHEEIEVRRFDVDDNRSHHCSFGLHVGSLDYAKHFSGSGVVVVVKVNPKDVVSVPSDYNCQKCRVSSYKVLANFEKEITAPVTNPNAIEIQSIEKEDQSSFIKRIEDYLSTKLRQGHELVSVKSIQNSFSPSYPSRIRVLNAISDLGLVWTNQERGGPVVLL